MTVHEIEADAVAGGYRRENSSNNPSRPAEPSLWRFGCWHNPELFAAAPHAWLSARCFAESQPQPEWNSILRVDNINPLNCRFCGWHTAGVDNAKGAARVLSTSKFLADLSFKIKYFEH
jgi:hypothetical protein